MSHFTSVHTDIDECTEQSDQCDEAHADCSNTVGSYECQCIVGFLGNGRHCGKYSILYYLPYNLGPSAECADGDVLLYNGSSVSANLSEGTVLVCYNNEYGSVCDDFWDILDASVVCNQLHNTSIGQYLYTFIASMLNVVLFIGSIPVLQSLNGNVSNYSIILDNVVCTGSESNLVQCGHNPVGTHNCHVTETAGVRCGSE